MDGDSGARLIGGPESSGKFAGCQHLTTARENTNIQLIPQAGHVGYTICDSMVGVVSRIAGSTVVGGADRRIELPSEDSGNIDMF